jgi:hypothetical protein
MTDQKPTSLNTVIPAQAGIQYQKPTSLNTVIPAQAGIQCL